jgi:hypothetical protein
MERSLLHIAAMSGFVDVCMLLVKKYGLKVDQLDKVTVYLL